MKYIERCPNCHGKGKIPFLQFFSKRCTTCKGKGRTVTTLPAKHL